jgi:hypothetical protein
MTNRHESQTLTGSFWTRSRVASGLVFLAVNAGGFALLATSPPLALAKILGPAVAGLFSVWFPEYLSSFRGHVGLAFVKDQTPGAVVYWMGWFLLVLPIPLIWLAT